MLVQTMHKHITGPLHGLFFVDVWCSTEGRKHVKVVDHALANIAMEIVGSGHKTVGAYYLTGGLPMRSARPYLGSALQ